MILDFLKKVYQIWISERPTQLAAALAYFAMFSIAPVIFIAFSVAGALLKNIALTERVYERLEQILYPVWDFHLRLGCCWIGRYAANNCLLYGADLSSGRGDHPGDFEKSG
jgi:hypothetical protein